MKRALFLALTLGSVLSIPSLSHADPDAMPIMWPQCPADISADPIFPPDMADKDKKGCHVGDVKLDGKVIKERFGAGTRTTYTGRAINEQCVKWDKNGSVAKPMGCWIPAPSISSCEPKSGFNDANFSCTSLQIGSDSGLYSNSREVNGQNVLYPESDCTPGNSSASESNAPYGNLVYFCMNVLETDQHGNASKVYDVIDGRQGIRQIRARSCYMKIGELAPLPPAPSPASPSGGTQSPASSNGGGS